MWKHRYISDKRSWAFLCFQKFCRYHYRVFSSTCHDMLIKMVTCYSDRRKQTDLRSVEVNHKKLWWKKTYRKKGYITIHRDTNRVIILPKIKYKWRPKWRIAWKAERGWWVPILFLPLRREESRLMYPHQNSKTCGFEISVTLRLPYSYYVILRDKHISIFISASFSRYDVLLTVHLSTILVIDQLNT